MGKATYAMFWSIGEGPRRAGRVDVGEDAIALSATTPTPDVDWILFEDIGSVVVERGVLHIDRRGEPAVHIGSLDRPGALRELAERLTAVPGMTPRAVG